VLVEQGVRFNASTNSFQHTAVRGKGGGDLEAAQQVTNLHPFVCTVSESAVNQVSRRAE